MVRIAIFASGSGSNMENIHSYFRSSKEISVCLLCTNKSNSGSVVRANKLGLPVFCIEPGGASLLEECLKKESISFIVLAGFLAKIPKKIVSLFKNKILNIHPSLLPKYGGKGMYGKNVHRSVISSGERKSGISIHFVDEEYDTGRVIFQKSFVLEKSETIESLEKKIKRLEYIFFPKIIESTIKSSL